MYTITLVSFPSGGCVNDAVDKRTDHQGYQYDVHFLQCDTFTAVHFITMVKEFVRLSEELFLMCTSL